MKRQFLTLIAIVFITSSCFSQPNWAWVKSAGTSGDDQATSVVRDSQGNVYLTGYFTGTISFGSGNNLISSGASDMFIAKYTNNGGLVWAKKAGGNGADKGLDIKMDSQGFIYVLGWHASSAFFGTTQIDNADGAKSFISKYDNSGQLIWVKKLGGYARTFTIDGANNLFISASFGATIKVETTQITANGYDDIWMGKFNSIGSLCWIREMYGSNGSETPIAMATSADNKILLTARFGGSCNFDGGGSVIANAGGTSSEDVFLVKYDTSGTFQWVRQFSANISDQSSTKSLAVDGSGNIYIAGIYTGNLNIGSSLLISNGSSDAFVAKLTPDGSTCTWAKKFGGATAEGAMGIGVDGSNNVFIAGFYSDSLTVGTILLPKPGTSGAFIAKYNTSGDFQWAKPAFSTGNDAATGIHVISDGSALVCGRFSNTANFHGTQITSEGGFDIFVAKSEITFTPPLKANFSANLTTVNQGGSVIFTDLTSGNPNVWTWTFQGVTPSVFDVQNPTVTYPVPGNYNVTLAVTNSYGESSQITKQAYITVTQYISPCNAILFDGTDDYVDCGNRSTLRFQSNFTVEAWINPTEASGFPLSFMNLTTDYKNGYGFGFINGKLRFLVHPLSMNVTDWETLPGVNIPLNQWSHVAGTYDGKVIKIYLNGVLADSKTISTTVQSILWNTLPTGLYIGRYMATTPSEASYFKGSVDDVRLWRTTRSGTEIATSYNAKLAGNETNLASYWDFNEGEGTIAGDATANNYNGTLKNGPVWIASSTSCWGVGIDENENFSSIKIYPNPFNNNVIIDGIEEETLISLFDISGKLIYSKIEKSSSANLNTEDLINGIYLIKLNSNSGTRSFKMVKQ